METCYWGEWYLLCRSFSSPGRTGNDAHGACLFQWIDFTKVAAGKGAPRQHWKQEACSQPQRLSWVHWAPTMHTEAALISSFNPKWAAFRKLLFLTWILSIFVDPKPWKVVLDMLHYHCYIRVLYFVLLPPFHNISIISCEWKLRIVCWMCNIGSLGQ